MQGLHLTADLSGCTCPVYWLTDAQALGQRCVQAVVQADLQVVAQLFHTFEDTTSGPGGVTATVLLAESHVCIHTWPELAAVSLDVYVCNFGGDHCTQAQALMAELCALFEPAQMLQRSVHRGELAQTG